MYITAGNIANTSLLWATEEKSIQHLTSPWVKQVIHTKI